MRIDVFTIFPGVGRRVLLGQPARQGQEADLLDLRIHDLREHTTDVHRTVDDSPFGGGAGMLMRPEPVFASVEAADPPARCSCSARRTALRPGAGGRAGGGDGFSLLCGRYEGVDHRIREHLVDGELSVGDVVLAGGEVAACLVVEAVTRLVPA